jgi:transketolase N-terminal domain/subunit
MGHIGGNFSVAEILTTLFCGGRRLDPANPPLPDWGPLHPQQGPLLATLYAVLAEVGFIGEDRLATFMARSRRSMGIRKPRVAASRSIAAPQTLAGFAIFC